MSCQTNLPEHTTYQGKHTAYRGHIISPKGKSSYDDFPDGVLIVDESGKIIACGPFDNYKNVQETWSCVVNYGELLILPGFIDTHVHLPQITQIGRSGQTLLGWLDSYIFPAEMNFSSIEYADRVANWFFRELARNGTTLAVVFATIHAEATNRAFEVAAQLGNRVIMGQVLMDRLAPEGLLTYGRRQLEESQELCQKWHGYDNSRLLYAFTPRFAVSCSSELLNSCAELFKSHEGSYLHTHLAESTDEVQLVSQQFPGERSYLDVYANRKLIGENTIFAHSIHLDSRDMALVSKTGSSLSHCPGSNFFLKSGVFHYEEVEKAGIKFGLGTDVAAGPDLCMMGSMKYAAFMQPSYWLSPAELFYRATLAGAQALNLDHVVGSLEPGKDADFVVLDPRQKSSVVANILGQPTDVILSCLVYMGDDRMVASTYVRGKHVYNKEA
jgi:guanine deaminase